MVACDRRDRHCGCRVKNSGGWWPRAGKGPLWPSETRASRPPPGMLLVVPSGCRPRAPQPGPSSRAGGRGQGGRARVGRCLPPAHLPEARCAHEAAVKLGSFFGALAQREVLLVKEEGAERAWQPSMGDAVAVGAQQAHPGLSASTAQSCQVRKLGSRMGRGACGGPWSVGAQSSTATGRESGGPAWPPGWSRGAMPTPRALEAPLGCGVVAA